MATIMIHHWYSDADLEHEFIVNSDEIYIKRIYLVSRTDLIHMLRD